MHAADFGVSAYAKEVEKRKRTSFIGTPYWMAPEVIACETSKDVPYDCSCDIWSLGITLLELAQMNPPYHDMHPMRVLFKIPKADPPTLDQPELWSPEFVSFIAECCNKDPSKRPSARTLLEHPFVKNQTDLKLMRDLYRLYRAPVRETLTAFTDNVEGARLEGERAQVTETVADKTTDSPMPIKASSSSLPAAVENRPAGPVDGADATAAGASAAAAAGASTAAAAATSGPGGEGEGENERYQTLTRTRSYKTDDGRTITVTTTRVVRCNDVEKFKNVVALRGEHLRAMKRQQRKEHAMCEALKKKHALEEDTLERANARERDAHEKKAAADLETLQKEQKKRTEKLAAQQEKELRDFLKQQKVDDAKAWKFHKREQAQQDKEAQEQLKQELAKMPKAGRKHLKTQRAAELSVQRRRQDEEFLAWQKKKNDDALREFELRQRLAAIAEEEEQMMQRHQLLEDSFDSRSELDERHMIKEDESAVGHVRAEFALQSQQMKEKHATEQEQFKAISMRRETEMLKAHTMERRVMPKVQQSITRERLKEYRRSRNTQSDTFKQRLKQKRKELSSVEFKTIKTEIEEESQKVLTNMDEAFTQEEAERISAEMRDFNQKLEAALQELRDVDAKELEELTESQTRKETSLAQEEAKMLQEMLEDHAQRLAKLKARVADERRRLHEQFQVERHQIEQRRATLKSQYASQPDANAVAPSARPDAHDAADPAAPPIAAQSPSPVAARLENGAT